MEYVYKTSDLPLAAAMMSFGYIFLKMEGTEKKKSFVLDYSTAQYDPQAIRTLFMSKQLKVDALTFSEDLKRLKRNLYE
jgi:hypothetical protein